jgi:uncharacterized protein YuzE
MKITYFHDTDTLFIELKSVEPAETREWDQSTYLDLDAKGNVCAITLEHARERADIPELVFEQVAA